MPNCLTKSHLISIQRSIPLRRHAYTIVRSMRHSDHTVDRRQILLGLLATSSSQLVFSSASSTALAEEAVVEYLGLASPPTSYGGYGGNADEKPKYSFNHPASWKSSAINKVDKGTMGVDCRISNPKLKGELVFVIVLSRAGEDNKSFKLTDIDQTFQGFAGADFTLQDALQSASAIEKMEREVEGIKFYDYLIDSPDTTYLSSITTKNGKIFAMFVKCPTRSFKGEEAALRSILTSFKIL